MVAMESVSLKTRLLHAAPPGARPVAAPAPVAAAPALPDDRVEVAETTSVLSWGKRVALAGLGLVALAGPAFAGSGPVGAAASAAAAPSLSKSVEPPVRRRLVIPKTFDLPVPGTVHGTVLDPTVPAPPPPPGPTLRPPHRETPARPEIRFDLDDPRVGHRFEGASVNDSFKDHLGIVPEKHQTPGTNNGDDNGWTAEIRLDAIRTEGNEQTVTSGRFAMVTERGSWNPPPGYGGFRTDIGEFAHQWNFRENLDSRTDFVYGAGLGIQSVGDLNGRQGQEWFHGVWPRGGRVGAEEGLQTNYSTAHPTLAPMVTGGAGFRYRLDDEWLAKTSVEGALPVGPGFANVRTTAALEYRPTDRVHLEGGVGVTASWAQGGARDALRFIDADGVRPMAYVHGEYRMFDNVSAFGRIDNGGIRNEPVYRIGITIHFGGGKAERAWLDPLWK